MHPKAGEWVCTLGRLQARGQRVLRILHPEGKAYPWLENETFSLLEVEWIVISSTAYLRHDLGGPLYDDNFDDTIPVGRDLCLQASKFPASEGMRGDSGCLQLSQLDRGDNAGWYAA
jgi:hypothetical protein